jgi:hypothetical protein
MMHGNPLLPILGELNGAFGGVKPRVSPDQAEAFAPGASLGPALADVMHGADKELRNLLAAYIETIPGSFQASLLSIIHYALTSRPRVLLNFSWAPAYDFELTIWEIVEPQPANSGISILLKGRYPDDSARFAAD